MEEYEKEVKDEKDKIEENLKKKEVQVLVNQFLLLYLSYLANCNNNWLLRNSKRKLKSFNQNQNH